MYINCLICAGSCIPPMSKDQSVVFCVMTTASINLRVTQIIKSCNGSSHCFDSSLEELCYEGKLITNISDLRHELAMKRDGRRERK